MSTLGRSEIIVALRNAAHLLREPGRAVHDGRPAATPSGGPGRHAPYARCADVCGPRGRASALV